MRRIGRELRHLLRSVGMGLAAMGLLLFTLLSLALSLVAIGLPMLVGAVEQTRRLAGAQRRRCAPPVESAYVPQPTGLRARAWALLTDVATWRDLAWLAVQSALGLLALVMLGLWFSAAQGILTPLLRWLLPERVTLEYQAIDVTDQRTAWLIVPIGVLVGFAAFWAPRVFIAGEALVARRLLAPTAATRRVLPVTDDYREGKLFTTENGRR
ncbi:sensor domain-containing protein, partial [Asanoa sp. NPDC050611]|uniref:sensor domain-containing protein n=1 Tax=Asanoa sp. NPDC050611 TaxID=3157098 RepID=UPI0033CB09C8